MIRLLDTHTINKIAAGEVVERPASVVKELSENSIDAKSSSITVEIKNGGIDLIRVTDNGKGIPKDQVEIAFLRHATSKIATANDLFDIKSLGFRGEALASISSVSKVELITKTPGELTGKHVEIHGGKLLVSDEIACSEGTTLIIRQLFFNVPARKAFLNSVSSETAKIADCMYKLAMAHPEVSIKYIQNNKLVFATSGNNDLKQCIYHLYGKSASNDVMPICFEQNNITVSGMIGKPTLTRGNRNYEHFFINGRYIKSAILQKATEEAYKSFVTIGKFPFVVLHININPSEVDVNVHPTKLEVKFRNPDIIYQTVCDAIKKHLNEQYLVPNAVAPVTTTLKPYTYTKEESAQIRVESFITPYSPPITEEPIKQFSSNEIKIVAERPHIFQAIQEKTDISNTEAKSIASENIEAKSITNENIEVKSIANANTEAKSMATRNEQLDYKIIGQLFNTYWLIEYDAQIYMIDQHAAHERVMYERYKVDFSKHTVLTQLLLVPETMQITVSEYQWINENLDMFKTLGFGIELFGNNHMIIREVPYIFNKPLPVQVVRQIIDELQNTKTKTFFELTEHNIIQMACKSAIKANDKLDQKECKALIEALLKLENPFTCPHGRPTIVSLSKTDIEKLFKRIQ
ncbi:MAG: DNA mismatch repair endonuclease MutL [Cellulosilyticaceae bacterium]